MVEPPVEEVEVPVAYNDKVLGNWRIEHFRRRSLIAFKLQSLRHRKMTFRVILSSIPAPALRDGPTERASTFSRVEFAASREDQSDHRRGNAGY